MDLIAAIVISILAVPLVLLTTGIFRIIIGLVFVLFLPGYVLTAALFPIRSRLSGLERLVLSFGISIAITPLLGLILNFTPWGVQLVPILITLDIFTIAIATIVLFNRRRNGESYAPVFHSETIKSLLQCVPRGKKSLMWFLIGVVFIAGASFAIYKVGMLPHTGENFTELYVLGVDEKANNYPHTVYVGESVSVVVGIINHEPGVETYSLTVTVDSREVAKTGPIVLDPGQSQEQPVDFVVTAAGDDQLVEFVLTRAGSNEPYRTVHFWIDVRRIT